MSAEITLTGLAANDPVPGNYGEIVFAQGPASGGGSAYVLLLIGGMLAAGNAAYATVYGPGTPIQMATEQDAISLFGAGSELHRMFRRVTLVNTTTPLYAIAVQEGTSAAQSTGTITFTGTATGAATARVFVQDQYVDTGISTGDTPTVQAANAAINVNSQTRWPVTAAAVAGVLTLTAKQKGLRSNFIRYFAQIKPSTSGVTVTPTISTLQSGGTVSDSANQAAALATILPFRYYYLVSAAEDATQLGALLAQVNAQALPVSGITQRVFAGSQDTLANVTTIATGLNGALAEIVWLAQSDAPPCELAATQAGIMALLEASFPPRLNMDGVGNDSVTQGLWPIKAPLSGAAPTRAQIAAALNSGISPIQVWPTGNTSLVSRITTRSLNGATVDYRTRDSSIVTILHLLWDYLKAQEVAQLSGKVIGQDPVANSPDPAPNVCTPRVYRAVIVQVLSLFASNGMLQNLAQIIAGTQVQISGVSATRMTALIPAQPVALLHQTATSITQVS